ncbi:hypothetical protein K443DRAFT_128912 [Laccaria amethystina LaAM-08-1]|uniref:Unplaced genomic scaffold K443scaffold_10, whole genome shotgun sequence n=1 Tax=Laccaria amethystina LaAM-08-1 TaxID=1095629 RepID=A0A0C9YBY0_9AGAR|nr:hypothetical protein K443DRAFT_128912 [Laccaria amethystina LaAM-08-1]
MGESKLDDVNPSPNSTPYQAQHLSASLRFKLYMAIILLDRDGRLRSGQPQGGVGPESGDDATGGTDRSI